MSGSWYSSESPSGAARGFSPAAHRLTLPAGVAGGLRRLGARHHVPVLTVLIAACQILLTRLSGRRDVAVGTVVPGGEPTGDGPGTPVLLCSTVEPTQPFAALLDQLRETVLDAVARPERSLRELAAQPFDEDDPRRPLVRVMVLPGDAPAFPAALAVRCTERPGAIELALEYDAELLDDAAAQRLAGHLAVLLHAAADDPARPVFTLPLLTRAQWRTVIVDWNDTVSDYPADRCVPELFAEHARATPNATAVICGATVLSYAELDALANGLAHRLVAAGVGAESRVGVLLGRSHHALPAMLAVLKAGGVYVPLHDSFPEDRIHRLLLDSGAVALLTDSGMSARTDPGRLPVIVVDEPGAVTPRADAPTVAVHPEQLAYVMCTSGSTGVPKGVAVTHRGIVSLAWEGRLRRPAHRTVLFHSPHAFDASTYEMWVPLLMGGAVVVAPTELTPEELRRLCAEHGLTGMLITAALFRLFAEEAPTCFAGLLEVWVGGESPSLRAVEQAMRACPDTVFVNVYGPTEATTCVTAQPFTLDEVRSGVATIGPPMDNTVAYVLDGRLQPVPVGDPGELYVGGDGLARGYLGLPALTAERFVADPFGSGGRLYRTGDQVRWNDTGEIEFIGRLDNQVKLRGMRVELGEIEASLRAHEGVSDAVVVVHDSGETRSLVAYVETGADGGVDEAGLRRFVVDRLPAYMAPSRFVMLDSLPINANGKIDRRALP